MVSLSWFPLEEMDRSYMKKGQGILMVKELPRNHSCW